MQKKNTHSGYCSDTRSEDYKLVKNKKVINLPIICCHVSFFSFYIISFIITISVIKNYPIIKIYYEKTNKNKSL